MAIAKLLLANVDPVATMLQMSESNQKDPADVPDVIRQLGEVLPARGRVLLIPHNYPDPDALASAAGMYLLLSRQFGIRGQILFTGTVSRAENRELLRQIRYSWGLVSRESPPSRTVPCILLDTSPWSTNVTIPPYAEPVAVIDHHPLKRNARPAKELFVEIQSGAGATCTMIYKYLKMCDIAIPKWLATVMAYAIASETLDLSRDCTEEDLQAYVELLARANLSQLGRIRHAPLPRMYYVNLQEAMRNAFVYGRVVWTTIEAVQQPEIVAEVADMLHRMERITWAFCVAWMNGRLLISIRSSDPRARCGRLLNRQVGKRGTAGGHHHMAAGFIDVSELDAAGREQSCRDLIRGLVTSIERRSHGGSAEDEELPPAQRLVDVLDVMPGDGAMEGEAENDA